MHIKILFSAALAASLALAQDAPKMNLTAALASKPELSNLTTTLGLNAELVQGLSKTPNVTLLAPSNDAFTKFTSGPMAAALQDASLVQAVLTYHVLNGTYYAANVSDTPAFIPTSLMNMSYTNVTGGQVVEAVKVDDKVYFISGLLMNSTVTTADIAYDNGVIHVIDKLLTLPQNVSATAVAANLTAVAGALTKADLVETVDTLKDVTIFAPSNLAFQSIGSALGNLSKEDLTSILTYHVVNGTVGYSSDLMNMSLPTVNGANLTIEVRGDEVFVNSAKVITPNVLVANGVVHVIDNVLNPANATATPDPAAKTQSPAFAGASSASAVPFTSGVPTPSAIDASATSKAGGGGASATKSGAAVPMRTGAVGAAALFGGAAVVYNL